MQSLALSAHRAAHALMTFLAGQQKRPTSHLPLAARKSLLRWPPPQRATEKIAGHTCAVRDKPIGSDEETTLQAQQIIGEEIRAPLELPVVYQDNNASYP